MSRSSNILIKFLCHFNPDGHQNSGYLEITGFDTKLASPYFRGLSRVSSTNSPRQSTVEVTISSWVSVLRLSVCICVLIREWRLICLDDDNFINFESFGLSRTPNSKRPPRVVPCSPASAIGAVVPALSKSSISWPQIPYPSFKLQVNITPTSISANANSTALVAVRKKRRTEAELLKEEWFYLERWRSGPNLTRNWGLEWDDVELTDRKGTACVKPLRRSIRIQAKRVRRLMICL